MISTCENALASQTGRRRRDTAERLHCSQDLNSKWKINALQPPQSEVKVNIWEIKPPDFSYKLYTSLRLAEKPSRTIMQEERRKIPDFPGKMVHLPSLRNPPKKAVSPKFITTFPRLDSHKAKLMFVESGKYPNGVYLNPKPHDFRQNECNLPNFVTTYEKDPFGLKFKSQHLSTVSGCPLLKNGQQNSTERFSTYKPRECAWDSKLILPKAPWPVKSASYTRHRRRRGAYSAFMDRVEEKFNKTCKTQ
uniref:Chromosome 7 open reading frame 78 n=2 Tax=Bos TaxID=9903 RepID=A0AAA9TT26_BOVIN